ncbi:hypothetical protein ROZALSC1DRAFT_12431 [Rozella allomycis CSF55]|uniref:Calponin-homology (CH) domain-containing protein n=1 Tax=Rozella allomycis (strain CSF55) TaxID=988480 RepID=A0A4P9YN55_ROZAC|nr:hypothetical protein ROZALSC1DRAFT_12431 [Rozella allomycis CSF55]
MSEQQNIVSPTFHSEKEAIPIKNNESHVFETEDEVKTWIAIVTGLELPNGDLHSVLKSGEILCALINRIIPNSAKFTKSSMPFKQMENINQFLLACDRLGCPKQELFQTIDLYEKKNMNAVIDALYSVSRNAQKCGFQGPFIGPKLSESRVRIHIFLF